ncbi:MAG: DUF86 domain-containing protein [Gemmatimonadetes bacterium]|nr:DUF86 domain-containing protein [Gemmatimonadota bacterium]
MTFLVERLVELRRHLDHLQALRPRVADARALASDLSLHNDVLFSLLTVAQVVIDVAGELSARAGHRFEDYTTAVRNLAWFDDFPPELVEALARLPGFRNVLVHEYVGIDYELVLQALDRLAPVEEFLQIVRKRIAEK